MPPAEPQQIQLIGVDVGGTFTDLVCWDRRDGLRVVKVPSTPPDFHRGVLEAIGRVRSDKHGAVIVHGSTVATNALLQRRGAAIAFVTTEGFRDMLLIGRQNRPQLYALEVRRPPPIAASESCFTVHERIDAHGNVVTPLNQGEVERLITHLRDRHFEHVAVCLLFSFINPVHERMLGERLEGAGLTVSLSCDIIPEFREYERASTTAINASLRPTVQQYLQMLEAGVSGSSPADLRIMHSGGGTLDAREAARFAARLVLSGPAGGVIGAAFVARHAGYADVITYDMGGTSTDVATVLDGRPQWTTATAIDGLPIGLPMFEINTIGAGGGSIAFRDDGGALRVGPQSAGAIPGPACYGTGGSEPTVTDANLVLGRIVPADFLGGAMPLDVAASERALDRLAQHLNKSRIETALGIVRIVEANMAQAVRAVTSRRGRDPRRFTLVSFGGAGGLHACGVAEALDIQQVLIPPYSGVLSALGMIVAPPVRDVSQTVLRGVSQVDDGQLRKAVEALEQRSGTGGDVERFADARFLGQSHELTVPFREPRLSKIEDAFRAAYRVLYGHLPAGGKVQIVSLRVRRTGKAASFTLPRVLPMGDAPARVTDVIDEMGHRRECLAMGRHSLSATTLAGPMLLIDPEATAYVPSGWVVRMDEVGSVLLTRTTHR